MLHVVPWGHRDAQLAKGINLIVALKGGTSWSGDTGLCGNIDGDVWDDGAPRLRSWPAVEVPSKENMFPVEVKMSKEMKAAGNACTRNATLKATADKLCKPMGEMKSECVKDICITASTDETAKDYKVTMVMHALVYFGLDWACDFLGNGESCNKAKACCREGGDLDSHRDPDNTVAVA